MFGIVAGCLLVWICALIYWRARLVESRAHPLPPAYPGLLPIIGHTYLLLTDTSKLWLLLKRGCEYSVQHCGGIMYVKFGSDIYYFIADPEDALVAANTCLKKHFLYSFVKYWVGEGLITGSGDHWHRHRKLLKSSFSLPIINGYLEVFNSQSRILLRALESSLEKGKFYPSPYLKQFALGSSYQTTFGKTTNDENIPKYLKACDEMLRLAMERFQKFWIHNDFLHNLLGYKKQESEMMKLIHEISDEIIRTKKSFFNDTNKISTYVPYRPLFHLMLEQHNLNRFTDQEISEELHTAIVAAFETTSHSLQSIFILLGSFPKVQEKMYEEIMQVIGTDRDVDKEDLRKLVYTEAVIKESTRMMPPVPIIGRFADKDVKLKNYTMRAGSQCIILLYGLNYHPCWGPDADQFRPERWLDSTTLPPYIAADGAFSFGKRSCLGKTYAMAAMKIALVHVVREFIITADYTKMKFKLESTLKAKSGHEISLKRRSCKTVI